MKFKNWEGGGGGVKCLLGFFQKNIHFGGDISPLLTGGESLKRISFLPTGCKGTYCEDVKVDHNWHHFHYHHYSGLYHNGQEYPDSLVEAALGKQPQLSHHLFQQLFQPQCQVSWNYDVDIDGDSIKISRTGFEKEFQESIISAQSKRPKICNRRAATVL